MLLAAALVTAGATHAAPRDRMELRAFQREHPCPATGLPRGACPGYQIDHADPLCAGGPDRHENMQWLTVQEHRWKTRSDVRMCAKERRVGVAKSPPRKGPAE